MLTTTEQVNAGPNERSRVSFHHLHSSTPPYSSVCPRSTARVGDAVTETQQAGAPGCARGTNRLRPSPTPDARWESSDGRPRVWRVCARPPATTRGPVIDMIRWRLPPPRPPSSSSSSVERCVCVDGEGTRWVNRLQQDQHAGSRLATLVSPDPPASGPTGENALRR